MPDKMSEPLIDPAEYARLKAEVELQWVQIDKLSQKTEFLTNTVLQLSAGSHFSPEEPGSASL